MDFICFDASCVKWRRCNKHPDCRYGEDEYMCDHSSMQANNLILYRSIKQSEAWSTKQFVDLPLLPADLNITSPSALSSNIRRTFIENQSNRPSTLTAYVCNRGIGILSFNDSIVCFCPPQYYGPYCEYHADRLLLLLHLNLSQSIYNHQTDPSIVIKLLVLFLFDDEDDQVLMSHEFHVRPALEMSIINKKMVTFPYSRSPRFRQHRRDRYGNRSDIIHSHPYAIRIQAYHMSLKDRSFLMAVWQYPIIFDYLPVFRFAKVLHLTDMDRWSPNPCSRQPCPPNSQCHRLMNDRVGFVCLCKPGYTGKNCVMRDQQCLTGYCAADSLCLPKYRSLLRGNTYPYCVCPPNRYGDRCDIIHDACQLNDPCLNGGSCQPTSRPDRVFCHCRNDYRGERCEISQTKIQLSSIDYIASDGVTIQYFEIDFVSLRLILDYGEVHKHMPRSITNVYDGIIDPEIIIAKLYNFYHESSVDLYLLAVTQNAISVDGTTKISDRNHCKHIRTFSNGKFSRLNVSVTDKWKSGHLFQCHHPFNIMICVSRTRNSFVFMMISISASVEPITLMSNASSMMINLIDVPTVCQVADVCEDIISDPTIICVFVHLVILDDDVSSTESPLPSLLINFSTLILLLLLKQKQSSS